MNTINKAFNLTLYVTDRDDVFLDSYKVTGSASRLQRLFAYHHFTLLLNADLNDLRRTLKSPDQMNITSKATASVRSSVLNLSERNASINYDSILELLIKSFFQWTNETNLSNYHSIDPLIEYEKISAFEQELKSEEFLYRTTPPFIYTMNKSGERTELTVSNGIITGVKQNNVIFEKHSFLKQVFHSVYHQIGKTFSE